MIAHRTIDGQLIRSLGVYLSKGRKVSMSSDADKYGIVLLSVHSSPWASLTFAGDRHHLVARFPAGTAERDIDATALVIPRRIVAIERTAWAKGPDGVVLTLDALSLRVA